MSKYLLSLMVASMTLMSCGDKDKKKARASAELATVKSALQFNLDASPSLTANDYLSTSNLTIESLRIPVVSVAVEGGGNIYSCSAGTTAGCMVELIGPALSNLLTSGSSGEIPAGTYDTAYVQYTPNCGGDGAVTDKSIGGTIKATYQLNGITYYTKAIGASTVAPAEDMAFTFSRCNNPMKLTTPVSVAEDSNINFKLYIDLQAIANGVDKVTTVSTGGCGSAEVGSPTVCVSSPEISITVDQASPTVEHYLISDVGNGNSALNGCYGLIGLYFTSSGDLFGGQFRPFRSEGQTCLNGGIMGGAINAYSKNADGTYILTDSSATAGATNGATYFSSFKRAEHTGTFTEKFPEGVVTLNYSATVIP